MTHFDEMTGLLYLEGQLDAAHARDVAAHAETCAECTALLRALESEGAWLRESLTNDDESIPASVVALPSESRFPWGWLVAMGFGAAGAYTLWTAVVEPWRAQAAQAGFTQGNILTMLFFSGAFWKGWDAMRSLMESSAVAILGIAVMWLLRKRLRRTSIGVVVAACGLMGALALPPAAMATETVHGKPNYSLAEGKEINSDLIVAGDRVEINGTVNGDLIVFSQHLLVNGHVKGDVLTFSGDTDVSGTVDGNVRAWTQRVSISGTVTRNVMSFAGATEVLEKGTVEGSLTSMSGDVLDIEGKVMRDLLVFAGHLEINGLAGGDIRCRGENLSVGSKGEVRGHIKYLGHNAADIAEGAKLASPVEFTLIKREANYKELSFYWHRLLFWGASLVFGIVLLLLAPGFVFDGAKACGRFGLSTGLGVLFLIATPIAAILTCCTIVGLGVGISTLLLYAIAWYSAKVFVGCWLGQKLLGEATGVPAMIGRMALGLAILRALGALPYWIGAFVNSVVLVCGLGAIVLTVYRLVRRETAPVALAA